MTKTNRCSRCGTRPEDDPLTDEAPHFEYRFRTTIDCRKPETRVSLAYEQSCSSISGPPARSGAFKATMGSEINSRFSPCNPLKRLDSDERIQGNPDESKARERRFWSEKGPAPRKSKRAKRTAVDAASETEPSRLYVIVL